MTKIRLVIVDDHEVVRHGLRAALEREPDMQIVGEASTGEAAVQMAIQKRPDVMLLDVKLGDSDIDGPEVCERVAAATPKTAVVMLTSFRQDGMILRSLKAGAKGYVIKDVELAELKRMIRAVYRGDAALDATVARRVIAAMAGGDSRPKQALMRKVAALSETDLAIIRHLAGGLTNKEIAALIHRSPHTIKDRLEKIGAALDVRSRTEIVATAVRTGLI